MSKLIQKLMTAGAPVLALIVILSAPAAAQDKCHFHKGFCSEQKTAVPTPLADPRIREVGEITADEFSARRRHGGGGGSCDGIHRCTCGSTAAREAGFPRMYNGHNLWEAREWKNAFVHTSFANATHAAREHHVVKLVGGTSCSNAIVHDEKGTYPRNVCNMTFVNAGGGGIGSFASVEPTRQYTRRGHRTARARHGYSNRQYASLNTGFAPFDRNGMH